MNADRRLLILATQMKAIQTRMDKMDVEWKPKAWAAARAVLLGSND